MMVGTLRCGRDTQFRILVTASFNSPTEKPLKLKAKALLKPERPSAIYLMNIEV